MKLSRTALKELKKNYVHILKKCTFLNASLLLSISIGLPANAIEGNRTIIPDGDLYEFWDETEWSNLPETGFIPNGGAIENAGEIWLYENVQFKNNTATQNGGAIYNVSGNATADFWGTAFFTGNTAQNGGALYNEGIILFEGDTFFFGNTAQKGGAIYTVGSLSGNSDIDFQRNALFSNNGNDIYLGDETTIHLSGALSSFGAGIQSNAVSSNALIDKSGNGTLILGDNADNTKFIGTFKQSDGTTIANSDTFFNGTNIISGGTLKTHGDTFTYKATLKNGTTLEHYTTNSTTQEINPNLTFERNNKLVLGAYTSDIQNNDKAVLDGLTLPTGITYNAQTDLFNVTPITQASYILRNDFGNGNLSDITFQNSKITLANTTYNNNTTFHFDGTNSLNGSVSAVTLGDLTIADNSTLDISNIKITAGDVFVGNAATLKMTLNNTSKHGALLANNITAQDNTSVQFTLAPDFELGTYNLFGSQNGYADLTVVPNKLYDIMDLGNGQYTFSQKNAATIQNDFDATRNEAELISQLLVTGKSTESFKIIQNDIVTLLQSDNTHDIKKALTAVDGLGSDVNPMIESVSTEHFAQLYNSIKNHSCKKWDCETTPRSTVWIDGFYDRTKYSGGYGFHVHTQGTALGIQSRLTPDLTAGIGYAFSSSVGKENVRRTDIDTNSGFAYAKYQPTQWFVDTFVSYSDANYEEDKYVLNTVGEANYDVNTLGVQTLSGYVFNHKCLEIIPQGGARYLNIWQRGYTDSFGTHIRKNDYQYVTGLAGIKVRGNGLLKGGVKIAPQFGVMFGYDIKRDNIVGINDLPNKTRARLHGEGLPSFSTVIDSGVELKTNAALSISANYTGTFRKEYQNHGGVLRLKYHF